MEQQRNIGGIQRFAEGCGVDGRGPWPHHQVRTELLGRESWEQTKLGGLIPQKVDWADYTVKASAGPCSLLLLWPQQLVWALWLDLGSKLV